MSRAMKFWVTVVVLLFGEWAAAQTLSINDVSLSEGNAGITTFTFTVSLSSPAGAGGVTFDIATADGTATSAIGDYTAKSLTGQTIPAGSSTYVFNVLVAGDTDAEPNETFFVNVTNVSGATVGDAQGIGTITNDDLTVDLAITKTDGVTTATAGGAVTYTITASNAGPSGVTGATVADTLPAVLTGTWTCVGAGGGTCTASGSGNINDTVNLPAGASVTYTVSATISAGASGTLSNTATISAPAGVTDPNPANNSATDTDAISALSALVSGIPTRQAGVAANLAVSGCSTIDSVSFVDAPAANLVSVRFPYGLADFSLSGCLSSPVTVTVTYSEQLPKEATFYKYQSGAYSAYSASLASNSVVFTLTDNNVGDDDPLVGAIRDPSGLGVPDLSAIPTLTPIGLLALAGLMILAAGRLVGSVGVRRG